MQEQANAASSGAMSAPEAQDNGKDTTIDTNVGVSEHSIDALQQELAKWRERVPKLAAALRERSEELEALKADVANRPATAGDAGSSGIKARDALIEELEAKLKAQSARHQDAQGQLHARDVEIAELKEEVSEWRGKWQSYTESLDEHAGVVSSKDADLDRLRGELDSARELNRLQDGKLKELELNATADQESVRSLESRNEKLFETTEMANRQIETLGENLDALRQQSKNKDQEIASRDERVAALEANVVEWEEKVKSRDQDIEFLHGHVEGKQQEISALKEQITELEAARRERDELVEKTRGLEGERSSLEEQAGRLNERITELGEVENSLTDAREQLRQAGLDAEASVAGLAEKDAALEETAAAVRRLEEQAEEQREEIRRLEECVAQAGTANDAREVERRQLSEQMAELKTRNQHLEEQLAERSDLVVGLEQEKSEIDNRTSSMEAENSRLSEALEKSQRHAGEHAEHIAHLDSRLERQKQLMENVEVEYAQVQDEMAAAVKAHTGEMKEKEEALLAARDKFDRDAVETNVVEERVAAMDASLEEARAQHAAAAESLSERERRCADLGRELEQLRSQEDAAKELLKDKVEQLEKQLRKQTKSISRAEEEAESLRSVLAENSDVRDPSDIVVENEVLAQEVHKLEGMVRDRTEQLNKLAWQQDMSQKEGMSDADEKMLMVLNQQLTASREDNARLLERLRDLEGRLDNAGTTGDDLSRIRGVGPKLVGQLHELGVTRYEQIATLSAADLEDENHVLHIFRGRIVKDEWIEQAASLAGL